MPSLPPPAKEDASQSNLTSWGGQVGYETASKEQMSQLAALPFLTYPGTPLLSKKLSVDAFPQVQNLLLTCTFARS